MIREYGIYICIILWTMFITYRSYKRRGQLKQEKEQARRKELDLERTRAEANNRNAEYWKKRLENKRSASQYKPNDSRMEDDILNILNLHEYTVNKHEQKTCQSRRMLEEMKTNTDQWTRSTSMREPTEEETKMQESMYPQQT